MSVVLGASLPQGVCYFLPFFDFLPLSFGGVRCMSVHVDAFVAVVEQLRFHDQSLIVAFRPHGLLDSFASCFAARSMSQSVDRVALATSKFGMCC